MKPLSPERLVLLKAADIIERDGWCQGEFMDVDGRVCAETAIFRATGGPLSYEAQKIFSIYVGVDFPQVPDWNDTEGRTKDEVVSALRAAAVHGL